MKMLQERISVLSSRQHLQFIRIFFAVNPNKPNFDVSYITLRDFLRMWTDLQEISLLHERYYMKKKKKKVSV